MFAAVNAMMLDVLAAVARKDYEDRRRRQTEGIAKAKAAGLYRGRPANKARNAAISSLLSDGRSWRETWMRPDAAAPCWRRPPAIAGCSEPSRALGRQARYRRASSPAPAIIIRLRALSHPADDRARADASICKTVPQGSAPTTQADPDVSAPRPVSRTVRVRPASVANDQTRSGHLSGQNSQL